MFHQLIHLYETGITNLFGYEKAVIVEEVAFGAGMFLLGMLVMALISAYFILRLHSLEDFGHSKVKVLRVDNGRRATQVINIRNLKEAFEQILLLSFSPFFTIKKFTARDERRTRRFVRATVIVAIVVVAFAIVSMFTVLQPY